MTEIKKTCSTCRFLYVPSEVAPCGKCAIVSEWKPKSATWDEVGPELLAALEVCRDAESERRKKLKPGAPATTYCEARITVIDHAIARAKEITE